MNYDHPQLLEKLAAEYVLGTMNARVRRRFSAHLQSSFAAQRAVAQWHEQLLPLHQAIAPVAPASRVWQAISQRTNPVKAKPGWRQRVQAWWGPLLQPALGLCFGAILTVGMVRQAPDIVGLETPSATLPASYVGVLSDARDDAGLAVSSLRRGKIVSLKAFKPLVVPAGHVAVLWALPAGSAPMRVGVLGPSAKSEIALLAPAESIFANVSKLAVSIEVDAQAVAPTTPFVLKGNCVKVW